MSSLRAVAISGNLASPSRSVTLSRLVLQQLERQRSFESSLFELSHDARQLGQVLHRGEAPPEVERVLQAAENADVLVVVSPVRRASIGGLFKHFFDLLNAEALLDVPVIVGATGAEQHRLVLEHALKPLFSFFGAQLVPTALFASEADFDSERQPHQNLQQRALRAAEQAAALLHPPSPRRLRANHFALEN
ncbi:MAG: NAD(P)H-dependent oxidoreductase [Polyangiaceae bacterium]